VKLAHTVADMQAERGVPLPTGDVMTETGIRSQEQGVAPPGMTPSVAVSAWTEPPTLLPR